MVAKYKRHSKSKRDGSGVDDEVYDEDGDDKNIPKNSFKLNSVNSRQDDIMREIKDLEERIERESPDRGYAPPLSQVVSFRALPLSRATLSGLEGHGSRKGKDNKKKSIKKFITMTAIQNACIPHALAGRDILGAAKTGSGKTLAFLVPVLERLYRARLAPIDGAGAIVLSPTRELALQIFQVLRYVGSQHNLSAGLLVGGIGGSNAKNEFYAEGLRVPRTNIIIATPGRLLQHLEQTPNFSVDSLQILVLDEADRILDMGFRPQLLRILDYIPSSSSGRQTLLFSATQTKRVADLALLSLNPKRTEYLGVHDKEKSATPDNLVQCMVLVPLQNKLDGVYSFIKSHLKKKTIVFLASCSQIRHANALFCSLQPGISIMALHGKLSQERRTKIFRDFCQRPHAVLFATDVASRGLDFPHVDWVIQADAPEDIDMYIHRVGRTARYNANGKSLLFLLPSEEQVFTNLLEDAKIPIRKQSLNPSKTSVMISKKSGSIVASNNSIQELAKKAFRSYVRSVHLMPNKEAFQTSALPLDDFASSLGLASTPNLRFLKEGSKTREEHREKKNVNHKLQRLKEQIKQEKLQKRIAKLGGNITEKRKLDPSTDNDNNEVEEDDLLIVKTKHTWGKDDDSDDDNNELPEVPAYESRKMKRIRLEGSSSRQNKRILFNDDGEEDENAFGIIKIDKNDNNETPQTNVELETANKEYLDRVKERLKANEELDQKEEKERIREKKMNKRMKEKATNKDNGEEDEGGPMLVTLGTASDVSENDEENNNSSDSDSDSSSSNSNDDTDSDSDSDSSSSNSNDDSDSDSDGDTEIDVKAQENIALSLIRNKR